MTGRPPEGVLAAVEEALSDLAPSDGRIVRVEPVGGGCIHHGTRVTTRSGARYFLKWNRSTPGGMFAAEADGLTALREAGSASGASVRIPEPLAWRDDGPEGWLLLEYIAHGSGGGAADRALGAGLALIHGWAGTGRTPPLFGWGTDNWIGSRPQANPPTAEWGTFWRDARLAPQLSLARRGGRLGDGLYDRVLERTPDALAHARKAELVHGDLWGGNTFVSPAGDPVLIDPAVHRGDGEVDLAMSELFGGFGPAFYQAYQEVRPVSEAYAAYARDLYQLYFLLVHVNLFGDAYASATNHAAARVLAALAA